MAIEHIKLSQQAKDQLIKLKRNTGVQNWNVLCRWAFCVSLAEPSRPAPADIPSDSNVEMSWKIFAGKQQELYMGLLKARLRRDGIDLGPLTVSEQFRLHLHRGIAYLAAAQTSKDSRDISSLVKLIIKD